MLITRLFESGALLTDNDGDGLLDGFRAKILIDPGLNLREKVALGNLAARLGHELVAYSRSEFYVHNQDECRGSEPSFLIITTTCQGAPRHAAWEGILYARGDKLVATGGKELAELLTWLAFGYPQLGGDQATTLEQLLGRKGISADTVMGLAVGRGKLRAVFTRDGNRVRRIPLYRSLWRAGWRVTASPSQLPTHELTDLFRAGQPDGSETPQLPIVLGQSAGIAETLAACHLALRLGLERTQLCLPLVMSADQAVQVRDKIIIQVSEAAHSHAQLRMNLDGEISLTGDEVSLEAAARYLSETSWHPGETGPNHPIAAWSSQIDDLARMNSAASAWAWLWGVIGSQGDQPISSIETDYPLPKELELALRSRQSQPITIRTPESSEADMVNEFSCDWEVDALWGRIRSELPGVLSAASKDKELQLQVFVSEPDEIRMEMRQHLGQWLSAQPGQVSVQVLSGYKPGFSWLAEGLLPRLSAMGESLHKVKIYYELFGAPNGKKYLELPSRWLQELYPIDELIAQQTGLKLDDIEFIAAPTPGYRYHVEALNEHGGLIKSWSLHCCNGERLFLDRFPDAGSVKTFTSWAALEDGESTLWSAGVPSDLERIWEHYQKKALPWLEQTLAGQGKLDLAQQPFFRELSIELFASEEDKALGIREERLSPLEAMQEEFYFTTLDWFSRLGSELCSEPFRKPGAVVPWMRKRPSQAPTLRVTLRQKPPTIARVVFSSGLSFEFAPLPTPTKFSLQQVDFIPSQKGIRPFPAFMGVIDGQMRSVLMGLQSLHSLGQVATNQESEACRIRAAVSGGVVEDYLIGSRMIEPAHPMKAEPLGGGLTDHVMNHEQLQDELRRLESKKVGRLSHLAKSFGGRSIDMIEMVAPSTQLIARAKLSAAKPTYLILARHHANEVSSTNAALLLTEILAGEKAALLKHVNVVIIPMENPDGVELHARLAQEGPTWKHHAARFNALGEDLSVGYFQEDPSDPGAKALTRAWRTWKPDVVGDNHGVPSHEWEQPFSGYVCPWFATFWMPRAFYYGIFTYLDDPLWPEHRRMAELLRGKVADRMAVHEAMVQLNATWRDRYLKYAHQPCPTKFPFDEQEYCQGMLAYCSGRLQESKFISAARRFPDQTVLWWTDEVNDETAQGDYLKLCVDAHLQANLAVTETLASLPPSLVRTHQYGRHGAMLSWSRPRPLNAGQR